MWTILVYIQIIIFQVNILHFIIFSWLSRRILTLTSRHENNGSKCQVTYFLMFSFFRKQQQQSHTKYVYQFMMESESSHKIKYFASPGSGIAKF